MKNESKGKILALKEELKQRKIGYQERIHKFEYTNESSLDLESRFKISLSLKGKIDLIDDLLYGERSLEELLK